MAVVRVAGQEIGIDCCEGSDLTGFETVISELGNGKEATFKDSQKTNDKVEKDQEALRHLSCVCLPEVNQRLVRIRLRKISDREIAVAMQPIRKARLPKERHFLDRPHPFRPTRNQPSRSCTLKTANPNQNILHL